MHVFPDGIEKPICFASRTLSKSERGYAVIHKEALAIYWSCKKFYQYLLGRHFELYCDHKPLMAIFGEKRDIPQMIAGQLQRWACFLSGFDYTFNYVKGKDNGGADGLSRLPITSQESEEPEIDYVRFIIEDKLPVDHAQIKKATRTDPILSQVFMYTRDGWPESTVDALKPYFHRLSELSINQDVLMWGYRVLIPEKHRLRTLEELHSTHLGASKMKAMARQYFWWPKLDTDIEQYAKSCDICNTYAPNPNKAELIKYNDCKEVGERLHVDFLGPVKNKMYLIMTDSYSKWPEVYAMNGIDAINTVNKLRDYASRRKIKAKRQRRGRYDTYKGTEPSRVWLLQIYSRKMRKRKKNEKRERTILRRTMSLMQTPRRNWAASLACGLVLLELCVAGPVIVPQFLTAGTGRNIRHLPCVSRRTGEQGVCMFAFTCAKANGTHLGTCIDRFYFGSCCRIDQEADGAEQPGVFAQDGNQVDEGTAAGDSNDVPGNVDLQAAVAFPKPPTSSGSGGSFATTERTSTTSNRVVVETTSPRSSTSPSSGSSTSKKEHLKTTPTTTTKKYATSPESTTQSFRISTFQTVQSSTEKSTPSTSSLGPFTTKLSNSYPWRPTSSTSTTTTSGSSSSSSSSGYFKTTTTTTTTPSTPKITSSPTWTSIATFPTSLALSSSAATATTRPAAASTISSSSSSSSKKPTHKPFTPSFGDRINADLSSTKKKVPQTTSTTVGELKTTTTKLPSSTQASTTIGSSSTSTTKIPSSTRFPPRNATTLRPVTETTFVTSQPVITSTTSKKPSTIRKPTKGSSTKKPSAGTKKPPTTSSTSKPSSSSTSSSQQTYTGSTSPATTTTTESLTTTTNKVWSKKPSTAASSTVPKKPTTGASKRPTTTKYPTYVTIKRNHTSSSPSSTTTTTTAWISSSTPSKFIVTTARPSTTSSHKLTPTSSTIVIGNSSPFQKFTTKPYLYTSSSSSGGSTTPSISTATSPAGPSSTSTTHKVQFDKIGASSTSNKPRPSSIPTTTLRTTTSSNNKVTSPPEPDETTATTFITFTENEEEEEDSAEETITPPGIITWTSLSDSGDVDTSTKDNEIYADTTKKNWISTSSSSTSTTMTTASKDTTTERATTKTTTPKATTTSTATTTTTTTTSTSPSTSTSASIKTTSSTTPAPARPTTQSTSSSSEYIDKLSTFASVTVAPDVQEFPALNMSNFKHVCGRRLFPEPKIVGGDGSTFGKWPWQISLRQWRTSTYLHKCGAALLNENWAITAAHCVQNVLPSDLLLRIGEHDLGNEDEPYNFQERRVQIVASHPNFDPRTFEFDLALMRFYEPVLPFQPNVLPICIPDDDEDYVGQTAYVTGWGRLYEGIPSYYIIISIFIAKKDTIANILSRFFFADGPLPSVLQEVAVPVINNTICEGMYRNAGYIEHIPHIFICAGWRKGGFDSCEGDSGGPLVIQRKRDRRWVLAGVISWGIGCAEPNQPGVYTRISEFREWINQILQF
ncbi:unnamed protein product [Trichogramma brassicae]|uniref:RNA-directed DNA polymerase n=1 Tax=Trichogramma brassicae TaxID=86971 RepID=A0A6H5I4C4_9HYME|nr:unnamed protein product [Trichogramma brassicae]